MAEIYGVKHPPPFMVSLWLKIGHKHQLIIYGSVLKFNEQTPVAVKLRRIAFLNFEKLPKVQ